jgi:hypothetical protein
MPRHKLVMLLQCAVKYICDVYEFKRYLSCSSVMMYVSDASLNAYILTTLRVCDVGSEYIHVDVLLAWHVISGFKLTLTWW